MLCCVRQGWTIGFRHMLQVLQQQCNICVILACSDARHPPEPLEPPGWLTLCSHTADGVPERFPVRKDRTWMGIRGRKWMEVEKCLPGEQKTAFPAPISGSDGRLALAAGLPPIDELLGAA